MCRYFLNISSIFEQYRDNTDNFGHYNCDEKFSYIPTSDIFIISITAMPLELWKEAKV